MGISSPGIGSNLDVNSIVTQLMALERRPITLLDQKEASFQAKLTGFGTLKGAISQFQSSVKALSDISKFQNIRATPADATIATASATSAAIAGTYALEVSKLAQSQKLAAVGQTSDIAVISNGVISFDFGTIGGNGTFDSITGKYITPGTTSFTSNGSGIKTVTIDSTNNSLAGIRDAINKANIGVTATIINDGGTSPYRLALSTGTTGKTNSVKISVVDDVGGGSTALSTLLNHDPTNPTGQAFSETSTAQNAEFKVNGVAISKTTNTVSDTIAGVTLNLLKTNSGSPTNITVERDTASVITSVNAFVKSYNEINKTLKEANAYDATTKQGSILNGEGAVRSIESKIRGILNAPVTGGASAFTVLAQIGVSVQKDGSLLVNSSKLQTAIDTNFADFSGLFAAAGKSSDSLVAYTGATSKTQPGAYAVFVSQLATKGSAVGSGVAGLNITTGVNDTLQVDLDGVSATITLGQATYASAAALAAEIQSKINGVASFSSAGSSAAVTESGGVLTITSNRYGSTSNAGISGGNGQLDLNFVAAVNTAGVNVAGTINGVTATGSGQTLKGATGNPAEGISLNITGGAIGVSRGTVNYSQGYAYQFDALATSLLGTDGAISSRTIGINASVKNIGKSRDALASRLADTEKRLRAQYTALDVTISSLAKTSAFLTQQLANLPKSS